MRKNQLFRVHGHFRGHIQMSIASNVAMIEAQNFQHKYIIYVSTCIISNHTKLNYTFRDMDPLSLILE